MTVNHAGMLKKEYFLSYLNLVRISRNCSLEEAKDLTISFFFKNNRLRYGSQTYERFLEAYNQLAIRIEDKGACCA
ncbi:hypothetical protein ACN6MT_05890 [Neobacillus niacini]|uniref:hypothetical protein n=1 Tax=Neobacillus niacini TaxID=86668 RepID=UPI003B0257FE